MIKKYLVATICYLLSYVAVLSIFHFFPKAYVFLNFDQKKLIEILTLWAYISGPIYLSYLGTFWLDQLRLQRLLDKVSMLQNGLFESSFKIKLIYKKLGDYIPANTSLNISSYNSKPYELGEQIIDYELIRFLEEHRHQVNDLTIMLYKLKGKFRSQEIIDRRQAYLVALNYLITNLNTIKNTNYFTWEQYLEVQNYLDSLSRLELILKYLETL